MWELAADEWREKEGVGKHGLREVFERIEGQKSLAGKLVSE